MPLPRASLELFSVLLPQRCIISYLRWCDEPDSCGWWCVRLVRGWPVWALAAHEHLAIFYLPLSDRGTHPLFCICLCPASLSSALRHALQGSLLALLVQYSCMYVCMYVCISYNPRKLRGVNLYPAATGGPARAHSLNRFRLMFMSYVRADREVDVRMGGGSTTHSQDGRTSQTRTACPTESSRRMPVLLLFQSGGPPLCI